MDERLALAGPVSVAVAVLSIAVAIGLAPDFSFAADALSNLGVRPGSAPVFNGGLVLAGLVGLGFPVWLYGVATDRVQRLGAVLAALALLGLAGVGVFPMNRSPHAPAALLFYLGFTYALFVHGTGSVRAGERRWGLATIWVGIAHLTAWLSWVLLASVLGVSGIAIPETVGAALIGGWTVIATARTGRVDPLI